MNRSLTGHCVLPKTLLLVVCTADDILTLPLHLERFLEGSYVAGWCNDSDLLLKRDFLSRFNVDDSEMEMTLQSEYHLSSTRRYFQISKVIAATQSQRHSMHACILAGIMAALCTVTVFNVDGHGSHWALLPGIRFKPLEKKNRTLTSSQLQFLHTYVPQKKGVPSLIYQRRCNPFYPIIVGRFIVTPSPIFPALFQRPNSPTLFGDHVIVFWSSHRIPKSTLLCFACIWILVGIHGDFGDGKKMVRECISDASYTCTYAALAVAERIYPHPYPCRLAFGSLSIRFQL